MASKGLRYFVRALLTESTGSPVYTNGAVLGEAIKFGFKPTYNDVELPGDDGVVESDESFESGEATVETANLADAEVKFLCGHTTAGGGYVANTADEGVHVGFGFYGQNSGGTWSAVWYHKVRFRHPDDDWETRASKGVAYKTPVIVGKVTKDINGDWKTKETFATAALAKAFLDAKAQIVPTALPVTANIESGTYNTTQSLVLSTAEADGTIYYTDDGTVPTSSNGTEYTTAIALTGPENVCIKAVTVKAGKANSAVLERIIIVTE